VEDCEGVVSPAFLFGGRRCRRQGKERLVSLRAAGTGARLGPWGHRGRHLGLPCLGRLGRLGLLAVFVLLGRPDEDVVAAACPSGRGRQSSERQTSESKPEVARRPSHSGAGSRLLQPLGLVRCAQRTRSVKSKLTLQRSLEQSKHFSSAKAGKRKNSCGNRFRGAAPFAASLRLFDRYGGESIAPSSPRRALRPSCC